MNIYLLRNFRAQNVLSMLFLIVCSGFAQTLSQRLLNHLEGSWIMDGTVMKKAVQYYTEGVWVLQSQFMSLHMKDTASPPKYEANLFIGSDSSKNQYVAHWLDSFGGAGARVVGTGPLSSDQVEIIYPYEEQKFRNLFKYDSVKNQWSLLIESQSKDGHWSVFAKYILKRR